MSNSPISHLAQRIRELEQSHASLVSDIQRVNWDTVAEYDEDQLEVIRTFLGRPLQNIQAKLDFERLLADFPHYILAFSWDLELEYVNHPFPFLEPGNFRIDHLFSRKQREILVRAHEDMVTSGAPVMVTIKVLHQRSIQWWRVMITSNRDFNEVSAIALDVTEKKQAEIELAESEARYRTLAEASGNGVAYVVKGKIMEVNSSFCELLKYPEEEIIGKNITEFVVDQHHKTQVESSVNTMLAVNILPQSGPGVPVEITIKNTTYQRKAARVLAVRDLSLEHEVQRASRRFFDLLDQSEDSIIISDVETGLIIDTNTSACQKLGYSKEEFKRMTVRQIEEGPLILDAARWETHNQALMDAPGKTFIVEGVHRRRDGSTFPVEVYAQYNTRDVRPYFSAICRDISYREEAQRQVRESNELLREAEAFSHLGSWVYDIENGSMMLSEEMKRMLGVPSFMEVESLEGSFAYLHPEDAMNYAQCISSLILHGEEFSIEYRFLMPNGQYAWHLAKGKSVFNPQQKLVRVLGIHQNIDRIKRTENELITALEKEQRLNEKLARREAELKSARDAAEELNRIKTNFLANMSHEIRTPINGILGLAQVMRTENDEEELKKCIDLQIQSGNRLLDTISSILDLSQLETEEQHLRLQEINVDQLIRENVRTLESLALKKGIQLRYEQQAIELRCMANETILYQVFNNVIGNAIKFTPAGSVQITAGFAPNQTDLLQIKVIDTGIGIDEQFIGKVFDSFQQESSGQNRQFQGNGLGLSIAKRYLELLEGTITVESQKGKGSTFTIVLPSRLSAVQ